MRHRLIDQPARLIVIVDITDPRRVPHELGRTVPFLQSVPVQPLLLAGQPQYAMFADLQAYLGVAGVCL